MTVPLFATKLKDDIVATVTADPALVSRANHTGTQLAATISDFAEAVDDRLAGLLVQGANITLTYDDVAGTLTIDAAGGGGGSSAWGGITGTLSDQTDLQTALGDAKNRANHTGTQAAATISDFAEAVDDRLAGLLVQGANITLTYDDVAGTLTIDAAGGGGGGVSDGDKGDITVSGAGTVYTIDAGVVSLAKMADMATGSLFYRKTAGAGAPEVQTLATLKTDLGLTGTNSGDQTTITGNAGSATVLQTGRTFAMTGDVTWTTTAFNGSANMTAVGTIAAGAVSLAKMANMATGSLFYRKTAGAGAPEVQTLATLKTDLGLTGTNSGDQTTITGNAGSATVLQTGRTFAMTGDVTWTTTAFNGSANMTAVGTIAAGAVSNAKLANVATSTIKGRVTAATGVVEDLTPAQARTVLGATTVGGNLLQLANPGAITFPRLNADNTVSALTAAAMLTALGSAITTDTVSINNTTQTTIANGAGVLVFVRNGTHGGTALILYENATTPVILAQSGPTTFQTTTPSGSAQIQILNRTGNLGVAALASTDRNGASLGVWSLSV